MKKLFVSRQLKTYLVSNSLGLGHLPSFRRLCAIALCVLFMLSSVSAVGLNSQTLLDSSRDLQWSATLYVEETGGKNDYIIFGEAVNASDGLDGYDIPNPPGSPPPAIDAFFTTDFPYPHNSLLREIKQYPDTFKQWNFSVFWTGSATTATMSWTISEIAQSDYTQVYLCDTSQQVLADMLLVDDYQFTYSGAGLYQFIILCSVSNTPPLAYDDFYETFQDTELLVEAPGVLANDFDDDGPEPLTAHLETDVTNGILTLYLNGSFHYIPTAGWSGVDQFTYTAFDGLDYSNIATVTITVHPGNTDPVANDVYVTVEQYSTDNKIDVLENDYDPDGDELEIIGVSQPLHGSASFDAEFVYYTPDTAFFGDDFFTYTITDNNGSGGVDATVFVSVNENIAPNKPAKPSGETQGTAGKEYVYSSYTIDENDDMIYYLFSWGDESTSGWIGPFESGETVEASHVWEQRGNYEIRVKAKDIYDQESEWSDPLPITMPKNMQSASSFLLAFLERVLERFPLLSYLFGVWLKHSLFF